MVRRYVPKAIGDDQKWSSPDSFVNDDDRRVVIESKFTCACCGFSSRPHIQIQTGYMMNVNGECLCLLCAASQSLSSKIFDSYHHGKLIAINGITQSHASHIYRTLVGESLGGGRFLDKARTIENEIFSSEFFLDSWYQDIFSGTQGDISVLADVYLNASRKVEVNYDELFESVAYYPDPKLFRPVINFWRSANKNYFI